MPRPDPLATYRRKRDFTRTPEPDEDSPGKAAGGEGAFVVQKHWASRLHYDFRLELGGVMKSWAVPKGPSYDPSARRMAVHVEDHPLGYNRFEGEIPAGEYGAGKVIIWDRGTWRPVGDPEDGYRRGRLKFELDGVKLRGRWTLVRLKGRSGKDDRTWLLVKERDVLARPATEFSVVDEQPDSVASMRPSPARRRIATARHGSLPETLAPMLATLADGPPLDSAAWVYEVKFDGYRVLARVGPDGAVRLLTRNGHDWSARLPSVVRSVTSLRLAPCWLDGEIVMPVRDGGSSFQALQNAFEAGRTDEIVYYVFDLPFHDGADLRGLPLSARRERLRGLLTPAPPALRFSEDFDAAGEDLVAAACRLGLEGVIAKRRDSRYVTQRSRDWLKLKCTQRQEFVVCGWTDPKGGRIGLGALLLAVHDEGGHLRYAGKVGTGFDDRALVALRERLGSLQVTEAPVIVSRAVARDAHFVQPRLLAEVSFTEWTAEGHVRHPVFKGLRSDKPARAIVRERPAAIARAQEAEAPRVSHPARVVDPDSGATKLDVVRYYGLVGALMMAQLPGRPVALLRAPQGLGHAMFFQKHLDRPASGLVALDRALDPGHGPLIAIESAAGLAAAAQLNVLEFHTWNAVARDIEHPDRVTFDLDPGEGVDWPAMQQAAGLLRALLEELGLVPFLKTSGGKGLHVVVPLRRGYGWDDVKGFSQALVQHLATTFPDRFVAKSGPRNRLGRIFIDYLRNGRGATTVAAWSLRARPGLGISVPVAWDELPKLTSGAHFRIGDAHARLGVGNRPWAAYAKSARSLRRAMRRIGFEPAVKSAATAKKGVPARQSAPGTKPVSPARHAAAGKRRSAAATRAAAPRPRGRARR